VATLVVLFSGHTVDHLVAMAIDWYTGGH